MRSSTRSSDGVPRHLRLLADRGDVEALLELGLADEPLELVGIELVRQVDDGPGDRRDWDAEVHRSLVRRRPSYVHRDAGSAALGRGRHLGSSGSPPADAPERRGAAMAQYGAVTACEDGCHPGRVPRPRSMSHGIDAAVDRHEAARPDPTVDRSSPEPQSA
jgi:hypothetical protein